MFFRKCLGRILHPTPVVATVCQQDYEFLHTLCTVWPDGPMAQAYLRQPARVIAPPAATEVRKAIEESIYAAYEIGQDQIEVLRRIEAASHADQDIEEVLDQDEGPF
jgi:hypothetical protein